MIYYNIDNKGQYTNSEKLAQLKVRNGDWGAYAESEEEFVMQSDNSGYVPKSEYIEVKQVKEPSLQEQIKELQEAMIALMGMGE